MPIVKWPMEGDDEWWGPFYTFPSDQNCTVFEDEEPDFFESSILDKDGNPIRYHVGTQRMDFVGFVSPDELEFIRVEQAHKSRRKRNARSRKPKA